MVAAATGSTPDSSAAIQSPNLIAPSQISAFILQKMKETSESYLGGPVTKAAAEQP